RIGDTLDFEIKRWSTGKQGNLRALLSTLQYEMDDEALDQGDGGGGRHGHHFQVLAVATSVLSPDAEKRKGMWRSQRDLNPSDIVTLMLQPTISFQILKLAERETKFMGQKNVTLKAICFQQLKRKMYETFARGLGLRDTIRFTNYPQLKMMGRAAMITSTFGGTLPHGVTGTNKRCTLIVSNLHVVLRHGRHTGAPIVGHK
ncbi:hypothetical protein ACJX0J_041635, partial [Zea mays]